MKWSWTFPSGEVDAALLDVERWPTLIAAVTRVEPIKDSRLMRLWLRWPIGIQRDVMIDVRREGDAVFIDIVDSEWLSGGIALVAVGDSSQCVIQLCLSRGVSGSFVSELELQASRLLSSLGIEAVR